MINPLSFISGLGWQFKLGAIVVVAIGSGYTGWTLHGWKTDSTNLAIEKASAEFIKVYRDNEADKATILQTKLDGLKANERIITREIPKIINRDVYRNICLDDDGLRLIESARSGKTDTSEPAK